MLRITRLNRRNLVGAGNFRKYLFYALGEVFLIVVGIFLALQLNNWNEGRKRRKIEIQSYEEVKDDLVKTLEDVKNDQARHMVHLEDALKLRDYLLEGVGSTDSVGHHLKSAARDFQLFPKTGAFEVLKSRGFEILENNALRMKITDLYQLGIDNLIAQGREESQVRNITRIMDPFLKRHLVLTSDVQQLTPVPGKAISIPYFKYELGNDGALKEDKVLRNVLESVIQIRVFKIEKHESLREQIESVIIDIEKEVERLKG